MLNLEAYFKADSPDLTSLEGLPVHERRSLTAALELRQMAPGHTLDLSEGSADALDLIVDDALRGGFASPAHLLRAVACYFSALLVHHLQAQYVDLGPYPMFLRLLLPSGDRFLYTSPLRLALDAWEKDRPRFAEAFDGLLQMAVDDMDRPLFVPFYDPGDLDPVNEPIWLYAQSLQVILGRFEGGSWNLVMVPHNLRYVDEFLTSDLDAAMQLRLAAVSDKVKATRWWRVRASAAFFGEMVREHLGGRWVGPQRGPLEMSVKGDAARFSPTMLCQKALDGELANSYALLMAYQGLMDFHQRPDAPFPLEDLRIDRPVPDGGREDEEDKADPTRQYDSRELQRQLADLQPGESTEDSAEIALSTQQYNSDELQRELLDQMQAEFALDDDDGGDLPPGMDDTDEGIHITVDDEGFDIDVADSYDDGPYGTGDLDADLRALADEAGEAGVFRPTRTVDPSELERELLASSPSIRVPPTVNPLHPVLTDSTVRGDIPPQVARRARRTSMTHAPVTVQGDIPADLIQQARGERPLDFSPPTVQGDIPEELARRAIGEEDFDWSMDIAIDERAASQPAPSPREPRQPRTERLTEVTSDAALRPSGAAPASDGASTVAISSLDDPRLMALRQMDDLDDAFEDDEDSTLAFGGPADPRLTALRTASAAPGPDERHEASTVALSSATDPRLATLSSGRSIIRRSTYPMSSGSIASRTTSSPHGLLAEVHPRFRPIIASPDWPRLPEVASRPLLPEGGDDVPHAAVAIDYPDHLVYINAEDLSAWRVAFDDVLQMACVNLAKEPPNLTGAFVRVDIEGVEIYQLGVGDYYEASRIFLPDLVKAAQAIFGTDELLVGLPNRNILLIARPDGPEAAERLDGVVQYCYASKPHALTARVFRMDRWGRLR